MAFTKELLDSNAEAREDALFTLEALEQQIETKKELIDVYSNFISLSDSSIYRSQSVIASLQDDIKLLKEEYAVMMRIALRQKLTDSKILFILNAESFSDIFRRWRFLKRYNDIRQQQIVNIQETQRTLTKKLQRLESLKLEKIALLKEEKQQAESLLESVNERTTLLDKLKAENDKWEKQLKQQERSAKELDQNLLALISTNAKKKEESKQASTKKAANPRSTFRQNKGALNWPVNEGVVVKKFGKQRHPSLKGIFINNNGIDIAARAGSNVLSVHSGKVVQIQNIQGYQQIVVIQHGNFYSVYSNLSNVIVDNHSEVVAGQTIGQLSQKGSPKLHFEIWNKKEKQNPIYWLQRK